MGIAREKLKSQGLERGYATNKRSGMTYFDPILETPTMIVGTVDSAKVTQNQFAPMVHFQKESPRLINQVGRKVGTGGTNKATRMHM